MPRLRDSESALAQRDHGMISKVIEVDFFPRPVAEEVSEKPRILIIDNNRDFTHFTRIALEKTGRYSVWEENDSAKAHQTALRLKPDLILLDIAMPETDGGEVAARIESDPALHRTPILFLTALVTKSEAKAGLEIHGHPFLAKPIDISDLIEGIERSLPAHAAL
jgi:CheY-like chemotaxis protein